MNSSQLEQYLKLLERLSCRSTTHLINESAKWLREIFVGSKVALFVINSSQQQSQYVALDPLLLGRMGVQWASDLTFPLDEKGLISTACHKGQPRIYHNIAKNSSLSKLERQLFCYTEKGPVDIIIAPLLHQKYIHGALCLIKHADPQSFLVSTLADCAIYASITSAYLHAHILYPTIERVEVNTIAHLSKRQSSLLTCAHLKIMLRTLDSLRLLHVSGEHGVGKYHTALLWHAMSSRRTLPCLVINCTAVHSSNINIGALLYEKTKGTIIIRNAELLAQQTKEELVELYRHNSQLYCACLYRQPQFSWEFPSTAAPYQLLPNNSPEEGLIHIPPLRSRRVEALALADFFMERYIVDRNYNSYNISTASRQELADYYWPENCQELKRILYASVSEIDRKNVAIAHLHIPQKSTTLGVMSLRAATNSFRKRYIAYILALTRGNQSQASQYLAIQRSYLNRIIHNNREK